MNTTTNYQEFLKIEDFLKDIQVPISSLDKLPRTIENGFTTIDEPISIEPESAGPLAPMFDSIELKVSWLTFITNREQRITRLFLEYKYEHPSGSNGYSVDLYSVDGSDFSDYNTSLTFLKE